MNYKEFLDKVLHEIRKTSNNLEPRIHKIAKNNGEVIDALIITKDGDYASPVIYLKEYYEADNDFKQSLSNILNVYQEASLKINDSFSEISYWMLMKDKIRPMVINYEMNQNSLKDYPHEKFRDLAILYYIDLSESLTEYSSIKVTNNLLDLWGIPEYLLKQTAIKNMKHYDYPIIQSIDYFVKEIINCSDHDEIYMGKESIDKMYVLTNKKKFRGACGILCNEVLNYFAEKINNGFYILPSSIHEAILIPYNTCYNIEELTKKLIDFNRKEIAPEEILSDQVYYYQKRKVELSYHSNRKGI